MVVSHINTDELGNGLIGMGLVSGSDNDFLKALLHDFFYRYHDSFRYDFSSRLLKPCFHKCMKDEGWTVDRENWEIRKSLQFLLYEYFWTVIAFGIRRCEVGFGDAVLKHGVNRLLYCLKSDLQFEYLMDLIARNFYTGQKYSGNKDDLVIWPLEDFQLDIVPL